jgi:pimeloyl-ACP methyl ester carboxylesterase
MPEFVTSADGTRIAYERRGGGPAIILVGGILSDRAWVALLAEALAERFTTIAVDRRGRGDSGDGVAYAVEREVEDIAALIDVAGDRPALYGHSSGAPLALRAAADGLPIGRLVLYEPPYSPEDVAEEPEPYVAEVMAHLAAGRRAEAITAFMEASGVPAEMAAEMAADPARLRAAPSMANDFVLMDVARSGRLPAALAARVKVPTLILAGDQSPDFFHATARRLGELIPNARVAILAGADHSAAVDLTAPAVAAFLGEPDR